MSISTEARSSQLLVGDGSTKTYAFAFKVFDSSTDITIYEATGESSEKVMSGDLYTVTLNEDQESYPGGSVTFTTAPAADLKFRIVSSIPYLQKTHLMNLGSFSPKTLNEVFDKLCALIQQVRLLADRALVVPYTQEKTPEEVLTEVLEIAATAVEYAQLAQSVYATVQEDVAEVKLVKAQIDELVKTFSNIEALAQSAQVAAASAEQDAADAQEILQKVREAAEQAGFSMRSHSYLTANATVNLTSILPSVNVKAGDLILSRSDGNVFSVVSVTETTATVGTIIANLRGPRGLQGNDGAAGSQGAPGVQGSPGATFTPAVSEAGVLSWTNDRGLTNPAPVNIKGVKGDKGETGDQGSPGPVGSPGVQGPMGTSPWAAAFGQFRIEDSYLKMDYVGVEPATNFTINSNGELEATV